MTAPLTPPVGDMASLTNLPKRDELLLRDVFAFAERLEDRVGLQNRLRERTDAATAARAPRQVMHQVLVRLGFSRCRPDSPEPTMDWLLCVLASRWYAASAMPYM